MTKRQPGEGTIETLPSGRKRVRIWLADGLRHDFGPFATEDEAQGILDSLRLELQEQNQKPGIGVTWSGWLDRWQKQLELSRAYVGMANVRSICKLRLSKSPFADWPLRRVNDFVFRRWVDALGKRADIAPSSKQQTLMLARKALQAAVDEGLIDTDPSNGIRLARQVVPTEEPWTYLTAEEQTRARSSDVLSAHWKLWIDIAIGTGLRAGEQWNLRLVDFHAYDVDPRIVVRYGSKSRAPKGRRIRIVPLFGIALEAAKRWLELLPKHCKRNPLGLAFPGAHGGRHKVSRLPAEWKKWLTSAGITRRVRWHDLRHTCGSSLVSGWWGRAWSLQEVRDLLGHASIEETERYAHLGETALKSAARSTHGPNQELNTRKASGCPTPPSLTPQTELSSENKRETATRVDSAWTQVEDLAEQFARAVSSGNAARAHELRVELARAVLSSETTRAAFDALQSGPHALTRALELAELVLGRRVVQRADGAS